MQLLVTVVCLIAAALAVPVEEVYSMENRIVGGQEAKRNQFPYQVLIRSTRLWDGDIAVDVWCGGALISNRVLVTAAQCLTEAVAVRVCLGAHKRFNEDEPERKCFYINEENIIKHENYNSIRNENDIALITLPEKLQLNDQINVVDLPSKDLGQFIGRTIVSTGWGRTGDSKQLSEELRFNYRKIVRNDICTKFFWKLESSQLCVDGSGRKSTCQGDEGGPLVLKDTNGSMYLVGISSFGRSESCERGTPTVATRITSYLDWIETHLKL